MKKPKLTRDFLDRIEKKVEEVEKICSLEIVPVISDRSSNYQGFRIAYVLAAALLCYVILSFQWNHPLLNLAISLGIAGFFAVLLTFPSFLRWTLPRSLKAHEVEEAARQYFLDEEVFATRDRSGIMIYISEMERSVFILADKGVCSRIPAQEWIDLGDKLAQDFARRAAGDTFLDALDLLAHRVAPDFPPYEYDTDELGNRVRIDTKTFH